MNCPPANRASARRIQPTNCAEPPEAASTALGILALLLWSTTIAFGRSVTEQLGPLTCACLIYLLGGGFGCGYLAVRGRLRAKMALWSYRYLLGCGSLFALNMASLYLALGLASNRSQVLEAGLINYLWPMLTLLVSIPILKMKARLLLVPGALGASLGVFLATTQNQPVSLQSFYGNVTQNPAPYLLALTAAMSWAFYSALSRKWAVGADSGAVPLFMLATGIALGLARLFFRESTSWTGRAAWELLYLAIGPNLAYVFWERAMRKGDMILVVSSSYLTPFVSTVISCLYLGVAAGGKLWAGCALIVGGAVVCKRSIEAKNANAN